MVENREEQEEISISDVDDLGHSFRHPRNDPLVLILLIALRMSHQATARNTARYLEDVLSQLLVLRVPFQEAKAGVLCIVYVHVLD